MRAKPPVRCTPCRVTYQGQRYQVSSNGDVCEWFPEGVQQNPRSYAAYTAFAKQVRQEASRQRRNRAARERNQAMRDLGLTKTKYGWE